jgi:hypothetical protein
LRRLQRSRAPVTPTRLPLRPSIRGPFFTAIVGYESQVLVIILP